MQKSSGIERLSQPSVGIGLRVTAFESVGFQHHTHQRFLFILFHLFKPATGFDEGGCEFSRVHAPI